MILAQELHTSKCSCLTLLKFHLLFSSVQSLSRVQLFATPGTAAHQSSLTITNSLSLFKIMSSSKWCHPTISSSAVPFSSCLQSFPTSGSSPMSQFFPSSGQSTEASASVLPMIIQDWLLWSPWSPRDSQVFSNTAVQSIDSSALGFLYGLTLVMYIHTWLLEKHRFDYMDLCWQRNVSPF